MTLREYIVSQGWLALTASEVHRRMNETIIGVEDSQKYTFSGVADLVGPAATEELKSMLSATAKMCISWGSWSTLNLAEFTQGIVMRLCHHLIWVNL